MSNLKPLVWHKDSKSWTAYGAGISYSITEFDGVAKVVWHNMVKSAKDLPFSSDKKTLLSYSAALDFVEKEHYPHFMSEFVKPSLTWIDVNERLPEKHTTVLVVYHAHFDGEPITEFDVCTAFFDGETFDPKDQLFYMKRDTTVTHWMLLPKLPSEVTK